MLVRHPHPKARKLKLRSDILQQNRCIKTNNDKVMRYTLHISVFCIKKELSKYAQVLFLRAIAIYLHLFTRKRTSEKKRLLFLVVVYISEQTLNAH